MILTYRCEFHKYIIVLELETRNIYRMVFRVKRLNNRTRSVLHGKSWYKWFV